MNYNNLINCKNCTYFPCLKFICNIGNKGGCSDFKSTVGKHLDKIQKKIRNDANET